MTSQSPVIAARTGKRILIVTSGHLSRNPRVPKEARALSQAGYSVTVIRVSNLPDFEQYDQQLLAGAPYSCVTLDQQRGARGALLERVYVAFARRIVRAGLQLGQAFGPVRGLYRIARELPADLTIVHTEAPFAVGRLLHQAGRRVAADFEDWHSEDLLPEARLHRPFRLLRELERTMLGTAVYTSTTSAALAAALQHTYGGPLPVVVRNTFPLPTAGTSRPPRNPPSFFWFSQTLGPGRGIEEFVRAWSDTSRPSRLVLLGASDVGYRARLAELCPSARRADLEFVDPVSPTALDAEIAKHDVGLALERRQPRSRDLTITNKFFQYANGGLAILASETTGQREALAAAPDGGMLIESDDRVGVARKIDALLGSETRLNAMRAAAFAAASSSFSWSVDEARLVAAVDSALDLPATRRP